MLGLAALTAAVAARVIAPEALHDRYLILAALGAGVAARTLGAGSSQALPRFAAIGTLALLSSYAVAVLAVPPPHAGVKAVLAKTFPPEEKLVYVEGGNGVAALWSEASGWRLAPSPSAFEASRGDVRLRIERIDGVSERAELGDFADLALSDLVDRGEFVICDAEGPGAFSERKAAWRSIAAFESEPDETDDTPTYGVYVVYVEDDTVYGARLDAPNPEALLEAAPAARGVLASATADPEEKSRLRREAGQDAAAQTIGAGDSELRPYAPTHGSGLRHGPDPPHVRPKPYIEPDSVRALRRMRFRGR